jgi:hypothetical protein
MVIVFVAIGGYYILGIGEYFIGGYWCLLLVIGGY